MNHPKVESVVILTSDMIEEYNIVCINCVHNIMCIIYIYHTV